MRKTFVGVYLLITASLCQAQSNIYEVNGNVGIDISFPNTKLHLLDPTESRPNGISAATKASLKLSRAGTFNYSYVESAEFRLGHGGPSVWGSQLDLYINGGNNNTNIPDQHVMTWQYNGNVGVGTTAPGEKLTVNGKVHAKEIKVDNNIWPDYVFKPSYTPMPLNKVEAFIKTNGHLPEVPSAKEVAEKGIEVGANQALLLKKIEELTLHLIQLEKKVLLQNEQLQRQQEVINKNLKPGKRNVKRIDS